jgi:hypothetical protein
MNNLYERLEVDKSTPVQYAAVYIMHWQPEWGEPEVLFRETENPLVEAASDLLAALDGMLDWALSNRGTRHEFVTCRSDGDINHPALESARAAIANAEGKA